MDQYTLQWKLAYLEAPGSVPSEWMDAEVPGAVQLDYARAKGWDPFYKGMNFTDYGWMEDVFWLYRAPLHFTLCEGQRARLEFKSIDYRYRISVGGDILLEDEGMFHSAVCDVTAYSGKETFVEVLIWPAPKADDSGTRDQARLSCKSAACYGWDWHPRLISAGIWDEAKLIIGDALAIDAFEVSYTLSDRLDLCRIHTHTRTSADCGIVIRLLDGGKEVQCISGRNGDNELALCSPKLWNPVGHGEQNMYTVTAAVIHPDGTEGESVSRRLGFRRSRLVMNEGAWTVPGYPKTRASAPATLELNGRRIFAKGTNWVNATIFPGEMNEELYRTLITQAKDCNMNILRIWGGGFINKESFYDLCDEMGIMVWQEFPLACNEYPDDPHYLSVLQKEAEVVVRRLRTHPCLVLWCGGNELFNSWSGMTEQHHALRLLDSICYREDRFTPFMMTSPLNGMAHGNYYNYDERTGEELITSIYSANATAYTEFGCPSMSSREELLRFMTEEEFSDCNETQPVWVGHHGFKMSRTEAWVRKPEAEYYFGGWKDTDDLITKTRFIQAMSYQSCFEEARRQWPHCSMALNWCFNEPWPTAGNNSLVSWPAEPKPAYYSVKQALRPRLASLRLSRHLWTAGERLSAEVWMLNDSDAELPAGQIAVSYQFAGSDRVVCGTLNHAAIPGGRNQCCGSVSVDLPADYSGKLEFFLETGDAGMDSHYVCICKPRKQTGRRILNVD